MLYILCNNIYYYIIINKFDCSLLSRELPTRSPNPLSQLLKPLSRLSRRRVDDIWTHELRDSRSCGSCFQKEQNKAFRHVDCRNFIRPR